MEAYLRYMCDNGDTESCDSLKNDGLLAQIGTDAHNLFELPLDDLFGNSGDDLDLLGGSDVIYTITGDEGDSCFKDNDCALGYFCDDL